MSTHNHEVYAFTMDYLETLQLQLQNVPLPDPCRYLQDLGLRQTLFPSGQNTAATWPSLPDDLATTHRLMIIRDLYQCCYILLPAEDSPTENAAADNAAEEDNALPQAGSLLAAGPFLTAVPGLSDLADMCTHLGIPSGHIPFLQQYYSALPLVRDYTMLENYLFVLGRHLYESGQYEVNYLTVAGGSGSPEQRAQDGRMTSLPYQPASPEPDAQLYHNIEIRYQRENEGILAIAHGDERTAEKIFLGDTFRHLTRRSANSLRNQKNFAIIANTLYRKAAESGGVHPIYLDAISSKFAIRIENADSLAQLETVQHEMVRQYCMLVQTRSTEGYSPLIRKVINYIAIHLSEDISLETIAGVMAVNKSYLSTRFRKETGQGLTDYINQHRIDHAISLLNLQAGSIQEIADACGIPDLTYFTRLFRRYKNMTPSEYKKMLQG